MAFFAHAGEEHLSATESFWHQVSTSWFIVLPAIILLDIFIVIGVYYLFRRSLAAAIAAVQFCLFASGILLYTTMPIFSVIAIAGGFGFSLFIVINGLRSGGQPDHEK